MQGFPPSLISTHWVLNITETVLSPCRLVLSPCRLILSTSQRGKHSYDAHVQLKDVRRGVTSQIHSARRLQTTIPTLPASPRVRALERHAETVKLHVAASVSRGQRCNSCLRIKGSVREAGGGDKDTGGQRSKRPSPRYTEKARSPVVLPSFWRPRDSRRAGASSGAKGVGISVGHFRKPSPTPQHVKAQFSSKRPTCKPWGWLKQLQYSPGAGSHQSKTFLAKPELFSSV